jgi:mRNA-degrading endonuclease RelE of RelBE toxin-antitoxin system
MNYRVYATETFKKEMENLDLSDQGTIQKIAISLAENPFSGDPLRYPFLREKRLREKRIYFLVYRDLSCVLLVAFGGKKDQQKTIDFIINALPKYKEYLLRLLG